MSTDAATAAGVRRSARAVRERRRRRTCERARLHDEADELPDQGVCFSHRAVVSEKLRFVLVSYVHCDVENTAHQVSHQRRDSDVADGVARQPYLESSRAECGGETDTLARRTPVLIFAFDSNIENLPVW